MIIDNTPVFTYNKNYIILKYLATHENYVFTAVYININKNINILLFFSNLKHIKRANCT